MTDPRQLWETYFRTRSIEDRNALVEHYDFLAKRAAHRLFRGARPQDRADLLQEARIAVIYSVEKWDPARTADFERFATFRIKARLIDAVRKSGWRKKGTLGEEKQLDEAFDRAAQKAGGTPNREQIAAELGMGVDELSELESRCRATEATVSSLNFCAATEEDWTDSIADPAAEQPEEEALKGHTAEELQALIERLSPREQRIIRAIYFEGMEQRDLATEISRHESRISQLVAQAVRRMRALARQQTLPADLFTQEEPHCANV